MPIAIPPAGLNYSLAFKDLYTQVLTYMDKPGDTAQGLALAKYAIQTANNRRLTSQRWNFMLYPRTKIQFTTGVWNYTLNPLALMITDFWNDTAKQQMHEVPSRMRYKQEVLQDRYHFEFVKDSPVQFQPSVAANENVILGGAAVYMVYMSAAGYIEYEIINGSHSQGNVAEILQVTAVSPNTNGITLTDLNNITLLTLPAGINSLKFPQIRLYDAGQQETGYYRFYKRPDPLINDTDITEIPYPFSQILVYDALLEMGAYNDSPINEYWQQQQAILEMQMNQAYIEGEMEGSTTRTIQENDQYGG